MEQSECDTLLAFCCDSKYPPERSKNERIVFGEEELHSEGRFVILSRQTQQGIPGKLHCIVVHTLRIMYGISKRASCHEERKNESSGWLS